jgi:pimeloyl-ACP methyl ester carboxylesterase
MSKHIVIYSHGFGVRKDDRGLFTDVANVLPELEHVMFDYNEFDDDSNTLTARPLDEQANMLLQRINQVRESNSDAVIDIVAHSQGCVVAALAHPDGIRKVVFLAPPAQFLGLEKREIYAMRPGTRTEEDGTIYMPRRDGSTTIIKEDYWKSREGVVPIELYNQLTEQTNLTIITATKDEILTNPDFTGLSTKVKLIKQEADHDFTGDYRPQLLETLQSVLAV